MKVSVKKLVLKDLMPTLEGEKEKVYCRKKTLILLFQNSLTGVYLRSLKKEDFHVVTFIRPSPRKNLERDRIGSENIDKRKKI